MANWTGTSSAESSSDLLMGVVLTWAPPIRTAHVRRQLAWRCSVSSLVQERKLGAKQTSIQTRCCRQRFGIHADFTSTKVELESRTVKIPLSGLARSINRLYLRKVFVFAIFSTRKRE